MSITKLYTAADLLAMGSEASVELIEGELVHMPPTDGRSSYVGGNLFAALHRHIEANALGFLTMEGGGYVISRNPDVVLVPDIGFVTRERMPEGPQDAFIPMAPDLAVEVMSHTDRLSDALQKSQRYLEAGTRLVWLIRPDVTSVLVLAHGVAPSELTVGDSVDGEDVVPGFALPVARIFGLR